MKGNDDRAAASLDLPFSTLCIGLFLSPNCDFDSIVGNRRNTYLLVARSMMKVNPVSIGIVVFKKKKKKTPQYLDESTIRRYALPRAFGLDQ